MGQHNIVAYAHNFDRYFQHNRKIADRLEQVLAHGILSPREAKKRNLPFEQNTHVFIEGAKDYDNVIFLFPINNMRRIPFWHGAITSIIRSGLETLTASEMFEYQNGNWVRQSILWGEVYRFSVVPAEYILEIILPSQSPKELREVKQLIKKYSPKRAEEIKLSRQC